MLIPCPNCERPISTAASQCPGSGHESPASTDAAPAGEPASEPTVHESDDPSNAGTDARETAATEPYQAFELPGISPAPPPEAPGRRERALDIPGSLPAGILLLVVFALSVIGRVVSQAEGEGGSPAPAGCVNLIVGIGLLCGGPVFRAWGIATSALGLVILPLILAAGFLGPAGPAEYLGVAFNLGMLLLLAGVPSRSRVAWGTSVAIAGILASLVGGALRPEPTPSPAPATVDYESLRETLSGIGVPPHDPQEVRLPYRFGGLSLTVPDGLPEVELIETDQAYRNLADGIRRSPQYDFDEGPPVQIFRSFHVGGDPSANLTEVYFPVRRAS